ncbi:MAG: hypothetical protein IKR19_08745 [Acholeplasmatales bacterium]|nr:hypothetical protein [Acholeplasmatales bacterium]
MTEFERDQELEGLNKWLLEKRKEAEKLENLKDKMEDDGNYDPKIYNKLFNVYMDIDDLEDKIEKLERM